MNLLKQNPKTARYQTPNKPHLATSVRTAQRHAGAEQKSTTPITRSGVTGTDKRTRNSQHGITRARSDRRNPYHSGGADGGDGELLVVGVVLREQICRSPKRLDYRREVVMMISRRARRRRRYPWPSCRCRRRDRVPSWPWRRRLGEGDGSGGVGGGRRSKGKGMEKGEVRGRRHQVSPRGAVWGATNDRRGGRGGWLISWGQLSWSLHCTLRPRFPRPKDLVSKFEHSEKLFDRDSGVSGV